MLDQIEDNREWYYSRIPAESPTQTEAPSVSEDPPDPDTINLCATSTV